MSTTVAKTSLAHVGRYDTSSSPISIVSGALYAAVPRLPGWVGRPVCWAATETPKSAIRALWLPSTRMFA
jgi:hypothetical protein